MYAACIRKQKYNRTGVILTGKQPVVGQHMKAREHLAVTGTCNDVMRSRLHQFQEEENFHLCELCSISKWFVNIFNFGNYSNAVATNVCLRLNPAGYLHNSKHNSGATHTLTRFVSSFLNSVRSLYSNACTTLTSVAGDRIFRWNSSNTQNDKTVNSSKVHRAMKEGRPA